MKTPYPNIIHKKKSGAVLMRGEQCPLPPQVVANIETVLGFQAKQEQEAPWHEQYLNRIAVIFGTSHFLYAQLLLLGIWILFSSITGSGFLPFGFPEFSLRNHFFDVASLLITTGVLVRQSYQERLAEQRSHLMLQVNLLTEQKTAKLIELLEKLREDLPTVQNNHDLEAQLMKQATDPQVLLDLLRKSLNPCEDNNANNTSNESSTNNANNTNKTNKDTDQTLSNASNKVA